LHNLLDGLIGWFIDRLIDCPFIFYVERIPDISVAGDCHLRSVVAAVEAAYTAQTTS